MTGLDMTPPDEICGNPARRTPYTRMGAWSASKYVRPAGVPPSHGGMTAAGPALIGFGSGPAAPSPVVAAMTGVSS